MASNTNPHRRPRGKTNPAVERIRRRSDETARQRAKETLTEEEAAPPAVPGIDGFAKELRELFAEVGEEVKRIRGASVVNVPDGPTFDPTGLLEGQVEAVKGALSESRPAVSFSGGVPKNLKVRDFYSAGTIIEPIAGDDTASTVKFKQADEVWLRSDGGDAYFDPFGGEATTNAIPLRDGEWLPTNLRTDRVSVYVPTGSTVRGFTMRYDA